MKRGLRLTTATSHRRVIQTCWILWFLNQAVHRILCVHVRGGAELRGVQIRLAGYGKSTWYGDAGEGEDGRDT